MVIMMMIQVNHHVMNSIMRHPVLGVPICRNCRYFYDGDGSDEAWDKDEDGVDMYCRWCGQVSDDDDDGDDDDDDDDNDVLPVVWTCQ